MKSFTGGLVLCILLVTADGAGNDRATCELVGSVNGTLELRETGNNLHIEGNLSGVPSGTHAVHVHENGQTGNNCSDAGGHYNPAKVNHGGPKDKVRHIGDWGNFEINSDPFLLKFTDRVAKLDGPSSILGKSIVIHGGKDDLGRGGNDASKANGNAGPRLACCVIKAV